MDNFSLEGSVVTLIVVSFCMAAVIILKKDSIPSRMRRPLAIFSLLMVLGAFTMLIASFLQ